MRIMSSSVERQFRPRRCKLDGARDCSTQVAAVGALVMRRQVWVGSRRSQLVRSVPAQEEPNVSVRPTVPRIVVCRIVIRAAGDPDACRSTVPLRVRTPA